MVTGLLRHLSQDETDRKLRVRTWSLISVVFPTSTLVSVHCWLNELMRPRGHLNKSHTIMPLLYNLLLETGILDFPGSPVVKTPSCYCRRHGFNPWSGKFRLSQFVAKKEKTKERQKQGSLGICKERIIKTYKITQESTIPCNVHILVKFSKKIYILYKVLATQMIENICTYTRWCHGVLIFTFSFCGLSGMHLIFQEKM